MSDGIMPKATVRRQSCDSGATPRLSGGTIQAPDHAPGVTADFVLSGDPTRAFECPE